MGDRIRMQDLAGDSHVFIRSMASRGSLGGLSATTSGVVQAFDAAGFDLILIETVGVGQAEVDIARLAHTTLVIEAPGLGDDIQAIKAGILEIADILVVNKSDRPDADKTERALRNMLQLAHPGKRSFQYPGQKLTSPNTNVNAWQTPIQRTIATKGDGILELANLIAEHHQYLKTSGNFQHRERARLAAELHTLLQNTLMDRWQESLTDGIYEEVIEKLMRRDISPYEAVKILLNGLEEQ
jgi:LAO/AO transport system kinase